jgi:hypothetical protein
VLLCPDAEQWCIVDRVRPVQRTRLAGRPRRPSGLLLRGVHTELLLPFRRWRAVKPRPEAAEELCCDGGPAVAALEAEPFYQAARRAIQARGGRQAQGAFLTIAPGPDGLRARIEPRDGSVEVVPLAGELDVAEPAAVPAASPRWMCRAGYRDDVNVVTRPPVGGWAAWWAGSRPGRPRLGGQPGDGGAATPATTNIAGVIVLLPATASDFKRAEEMRRSASADGAGVAIRQVRPVLLPGMAVGHSTRRQAPAGAVSEGHRMAGAHSRSLVSIITR